MDKPTRLYTPEAVASWSRTWPEHWVREAMTGEASGMAPNRRFFRFGKLTERVDLEGANEWRAFWELEPLEDDVPEKTVYQMSDLAEMMDVTRQWLYLWDDMDFLQEPDDDETVVSITEARDWFGRKATAGLPAVGRMKAKDLAIVIGVPYEQVHKLGKPWQAEHHNGQRMLATVFLPYDVVTFFEHYAIEIPKVEKAMDAEEFTETMTA